MPGPGCGIGPEAERGRPGNVASVVRLSELWLCRTDPHCSAGMPMWVAAIRVVRALFTWEKASQEGIRQLSGWETRPQNQEMVRWRVELPCRSLQ